MVYKHDKNGRFLLYIKLLPLAKKDALSTDIFDDGKQKWLKASVRPAPEDGKANKALLKCLSKTLKIPQKCLTLEKGETQRFKVIACTEDLSDHPFFADT